jgi:hypothetical protein
MFLSVQFVNLLISLSFVDLNLTLFSLPFGVGSPNYFSSTVEFSTFIISFTLSLFVSMHPAQNRMEHFAGLINWPVLLSYLCNALFTVTA